MFNSGRLPSWAPALAVQLALGSWFLRSAAATFDEPAHLAAGYASLAAGEYRINGADHPPLAEMWSALPLLPLRPRAFAGEPAREERRPYHYGDRFLYRNSVAPDLLLGLARAFNLLSWSLLAGWALWGWGRELGGEAAATGALWAAALCPPLLTNMTLANTDGASAAFFFLSTRLLAGGRHAWAGACAGWALASKFNMIVLLPTAAVLMLAEGRLAPRRRRAWRELLAFCGCAALALAGVYRFVHLPLYWKGLLETLARLEQGRASFLLGERSVTGSWLYFPVALLVKTPLPILGLAAAGLAAELRGWDRARVRRRLFLLLPPAAYMAAALSVRLQIGVRHLLPVYPFLALLAGLGAARLWGAGRRGRAALGGLALWAALSVGRASPHLLAYFNELSGGPANGVRVLSDSNLDWGQDLKGLGEALRRMGSPPVFLSYFGTADPAAYGIRYAPVAMAPHVERHGTEQGWRPADRVLLAVSATNLQGVYFADPSLWAWLEEREPLAVIGYSIYLYDLTGDPDGRRRLRRLLPPGPGREEL